MPNTDLSILVVDDAKFSSAVIGKTLRIAGFKDVRLASNAKGAIEILEKRPVNLLIADWVMPQMDGLELAEKVRQIDEATSHFTYIILLTSKEGPDAMKLAFDSGIDDFINKPSMNKQLLPRIYAADRISTLQNRLLKENQQLIETNQKLRKYSTLDPLTGIGNKIYLERTVQRTIKQCKSRGGVLGFILITINDIDDIKEKYSKTVIRQLVVGISRRLRQLVRPLDTITRISINEFAIVTYNKSMDQCKPTSFRRIFEGINYKAYKTSAGYISINASIGLCATDCLDDHPANTNDIMIKAREVLPESMDSRRVIRADLDTEIV